MWMMRVCVPFVSLVCAFCAGLAHTMDAATTLALIHAAQNVVAQGIETVLATTTHVLATTTDVLATTTDVLGTTRHVLALVTAGTPLLSKAQDRHEK